MMIISIVLFLPLCLAGAVFIPLILLWIFNIVYGVAGLAKWISGIGQKDVYTVTGEKCTCPKCAFIWLSHD